MARTTLFVYGSLKRGQCNHGYLAGQEFLTAARTLPYYRLYLRGGFACLVEDPTNGLAVHGEVWRVDDEAANVVRLVQTQVLPGLATVEGAKDSVAPGDAVAGVGLAGADPDDLGARRADGDGADGGVRPAGEDARPAPAVVAGLPDAPWPPVYPKMPGEPPRVAPSRAKKPST